MATLEIYGASDDLVEISGIEGADEYNCDGSWRGVIEAPDGSTANVYVDYRDNGCWTVSLGLFEEEFHLPTWEVSTAFDPAVCRYSTIATIQVPEGTTIKESK